MNELNNFDNGGTHESSPIGGIPMGVNPTTGQQQTVEQGETMFNLGGTDFIFSTNYNITASDISNFSLPKNLLGLNMADATKKVSERFKDREDAISTNTKKEFLNRIAEAQEAKKAEQMRIEAAMKMNNDQGFIGAEGGVAPDYDQTQEPENTSPMGEMMPFAYGGPLGYSNSVDLASQNGKFNQFQKPKNTGMGNLGMIGNMAGSFGNALSGNEIGNPQDNQMIDGVKDSIAQATGPFGQLFRGVQKMGQGIGNTIGGEGGAAVSGIFSPEEATIANFKDDDLNMGQKLLGTIPGVGGVIAHRSQKKKEDKLIAKRATIANNVFSDQEKFKKGGPIVTSNREMVNPIGTQLTPATYIQKLTPPPTTTTNFNQANVYQPTQKDRFNLKVNNVVDKFKNTNVDSTDLMRMAPVFNNLRQLNQQQQPYHRMPTYDISKANRRYMDVENQVRGVDTMSNNMLASLNQMGGSTGARRRAMLATNMQRNRAIGEAYTRGTMYNNQIDDRADAIDTQVRMENLRRQEQANENYDRDMGAYLTNRSALQNTMYNSIGNIGLENRNSKTIEKMYGYDTKGNYTSGGNSTASPTSNSVQDTVNKYTSKNAKTNTPSNVGVNSDYTSSPLRTFQDIEKEVNSNTQNTSEPKKKTNTTRKQTTAKPGTIMISDSDLNDESPTVNQPTQETSKSNADIRNLKAPDNSKWFNSVSNVNIPKFMSSEGLVDKFMNMKTSKSEPVKSVGQANPNTITNTNRNVENVKASTSYDDYVFNLQNAGLPSSEIMSKEQYLKVKKNLKK